VEKGIAHRPAFRIHNSEFKYLPSVICHLISDFRHQASVI
jgi:hypothetical protein